MLVLKSKLNVRDLVQEQNTWAWSVQRQSAAFTRWIKYELLDIDMETRKLLTVCS